MTSAITLTVAQRRALNRLDGAKNAIKITEAMRYLIAIGFAVETFNYGNRMTVVDGVAAYRQTTTKSGLCLITDAGCEFIRANR